VRFHEDGGYRISHGGDFGGYRSAVIHDSSSGLTLAVQGNYKKFEAPDFAFELFGTLTAD
jgi:D-alanyl-D-alanine carboxypeptidase